MVCIKHIYGCVIRFDDSLDNNLPEYCVICLCEYKLGDLTFITICKHKYHFYCLNYWMEKSRLCPICKFKL